MNPLKRLPLLALISATATVAAQAADNPLTAAEKKDGWT